MARPFPGPTTIFERPDRADGAASAGAGATIWDTIDLGGGSSSLVVSDHLLAITSNDNGALTVGSFDDLLHVIFFDTITAGPFGYFWHVQNGDSGSWEAYWLVADALDWQLKKRVGGVVTTLDEATVTSSLFAGVAVRSYNGLHEVYRYEQNEYDQTPLLSATDTDLGSGKIRLNLPFTSWRVREIQQADPSLALPDGPFMLHVNPDHPDASDDRTRLEASDPDTPLLTATAAANLAYATPDDADTPWGDTVLVYPAENANPDDQHGETSVYNFLDHRSFSRGTFPGGWPFGDNDGFHPITVKGNLDVDGTKPKMAGLNTRGLTNWVFEDIQFGYDVGSGFEYNTITTLERVGDLQFTRIFFTGGGHQVFLSTGFLNYTDCDFRSGLNPAGLGQNDGRALVFSYGPNDADGGENSADITISQCRFTLVRSDAIQVVMGGKAPADQWGTFICEDCVFWNVTANGEGGNDTFHTDAIQSAGGPAFIIRRNIFIGCDDAYIASDFGHGLIRIESNLMVGWGGNIQVQGYDHFVMQHNTIINYFFAVDASVIFSTRYTPTNLLTEVRNNIVGGFQFRDGSARDNLDDASIFENNLVFTDPGGEIPGGWGTNINGLPELGTSARLDDIPDTTVMPGFPDPIPRNYELSNTPINSPGLGQGSVLEDPPATDLFGRAWADPPDVGCLQSDPGTAVTPTARPPYVLVKFPAVNASGVARNVSVVATLYPKAGESIEPDTIDVSSAYVTDPTNTVLPAVVSLGGLDGNGKQTVTIDPRGSFDDLAHEGLLLPLVTYTAHLTADIEDSEGSALVATSWAFVIIGPDGPAIEETDEVIAQFTIRAAPWPVGTVVGVYPAVAFPPGSAQPSGPAVAQGTVASNSTVGFDGLLEDIKYVAFADGRAVTFMVPSPVFKTVRVQ